MSDFRLGDKVRIHHVYNEVKRPNYFKDSWDYRTYSIVSADLGEYHAKVGTIVSSYSPILNQEVFEAVVHGKVTVQFEDSEGVVECCRFRPDQLIAI